MSARMHISFGSLNNLISEQLGYIISSDVIALQRQHGFKSLGRGDIFFNPKGLRIRFVFISIRSVKTWTFTYLFNAINGGS